LAQPWQQARATGKPPSHWSKVQLIGEQLTVRIQPRWLGRLAGAQALAAVAADGVEVGLIRDNATWQGIEFRPLS